MQSSTAVLSISDAADHVGVGENSPRANRMIVEYTYAGRALVDTPFYDATLEESGCCTNGRLAAVKPVRGPLVSGIRNRTDFPGGILMLRDML